MNGALLVPHEDVLDRRVENRVVCRENRASRVAEDDVDTQLLQAAHNGLGTGHGLLIHGSSSWEVASSSDVSAHQGPS
jgi:hypothetical protein